MAHDDGGWFPPKTISDPTLLSGGSDGLFRSTIYRFVQAAARLENCREAFGRDMGLTASQYVVLMGVAYLQGANGVGIAAVAADVGLAPPHVTTEVGRLMRKGLLDKRQNEADRRGVLVSLTADGKRAIEDVIPLVRTINDILFKDFSRDDIDTMRSISEKIIRSCEYAAIEIKIHESRKAPDDD